MNIFEFSAKIERGVIQLPKQYEAYDNTFARITVLIEPPLENISKKEKLLATFKKLQQTPVFDSIENPVTWQKQLRGDWDDFINIDDQVVIRRIDEYKI
jgi:hypothetical protein